MRASTRVERQFDVRSRARAGRALSDRRRAAGSQISSVISACCSGDAAQLQIEPAPRLLLERAAARDRHPAGTRRASRRDRSRARRTPSRPSSSSALFTSQAILGRRGVFEPRLEARQHLSPRPSARASPGRHARPMRVESEFALGRLSRSPPLPARPPESPAAIPRAPPPIPAPGNRARAYPPLGPSSLSRL